MTNNLKFDEIVDSGSVEDILGAFEVGSGNSSNDITLAAEFGAKNEEEDMPSFEEESVVNADDKEQANMSEKTVTISATQFSDLLNMVKGLTSEVAGLKAGKGSADVKSADVKVAEKVVINTDKKSKRTRAEYMLELKEKAKVKAAERFTKCLSDSGKSEAEVKAAFKVAHSFAAQDQSKYKARFDEKLFELIGAKKYAA
jgi:hypothetical protein